MTTTRIKALIFDFDGVIHDTFDINYRINNIIHHHELPDISIEEYKRLANLEKETLKKEITENTPFYSLVIFGSYAINQQKDNSDLDIAIFIEKENNKKQIEALVNSAKLKSTIEIDAHIIPKSEMIEMLTNKEENLGKQIARKHLAYYNNRIFYEIIKEGRDHGFRI